MEFTVSKAELVRELSLSQGVVEKKTTIPILSNVLMEANGDRITLTATDLELGIRCSCPARVKKEGAGTVPARKLLDYVAGLRSPLAGGRYPDEVSGEPLGEHYQRPFADQNCRYVP
jgi:DNA polymerase III sliding clamp (beta) subunit (PCNA family)